MIKYVSILWAHRKCDDVKLKRIIDIQLLLAYYLAIIKIVFMKICAVVVTYFPNAEETVSNILRYIEYVDHLIIWENTPKEKLGEHKIQIPEYDSIISYMGTGKNEGIGYALNRAVEYATKNHYTHLLTMDQDSQWVDFCAFKKLAIMYMGKYVLACPNVNGRWEQKIKPDVKACITSGSLYDLSIFGRIGLFREDYFIDAVDTEFCYRIKRNGGSIYVFGQTSLMQTYGSPTKLGRYTLTNYSPFRTYHIIRNHIWLWREYPDIITPEQKKWLLKSNIISRFILIVLLECDKWKKLVSLFRGIYHGLFKYKPSRMD